MTNVILTESYFFFENCVCKCKKKPSCKILNPRFLRSVAEKHGLPILAKFHAFSVVGCPPEIMGIGPAVAIPAALKQAGMKVED